MDYKGDLYLMDRIIKLNSDVLVEPCISIIIPVYNTEKYIRSCLESVINQTYSNIEIICINDASTDKGWDIVQEFALKDGRFKLINFSANYGQSKARNAGIQVASGKYVLFLDSDDSLSLEAVAELCEAAEKDNCEIVFYDVEYLYENPGLAITYFLKGHIGEYDGRIMSGLEALDEFQHAYNPPMLVAVLAFTKREFLLENDLYFCEGIVHEDVLFIFQTFLKAKQIKFVGKPYYKYYRREGSTTTAGCIEKKLYSYITIYHEACKTFLSQEIPIKYYETASIWLAKMYTNILTLLKSKQCKNFNFANSIQEKYRVFFLQQLRGGYCRELREDEIETLQNKIILLYGAGTVARATMRYFSAVGINKFQVVVTKADDDEYLCGNKVVSIDDIHVDKENCIVCIAISASKQEEIVKRLQEMGYEHIWSMVK